MPAKYTDMTQRNVFKKILLYNFWFSIWLWLGQNHEIIMILKRHFNLLRAKKHMIQKYSQATSTFILYQTRSKIKTGSLSKHLLFFTITTPSTSHTGWQHCPSLWKSRGYLDSHFCLPKQEVTSPLIVVRIAPSPMLDTTPLLPSSPDKSNTLTPHHSNYNTLKLWTPPYHISEINWWMSILFNGTKERKKSKKMFYLL